MGGLAYRYAVGALHGSRAPVVTLRVHSAECRGMSLVVAVDGVPVLQLPLWWREEQGVRFQGHWLWRAALVWGRPVTLVCSRGMWGIMRWPRLRRRQ